MKLSERTAKVTGFTLADLVHIVSGGLSFKAAIGDLFRASVPIGTIATAAMDNGTWLQMNGQSVVQATYPDLFKIIGHQPEFDWKTTPVLNSASNAINGIAFGNGTTYVAVGKAGVIYTSTNLTSWTSRTSGVATDLNAVIWDTTNSLFIAVGASNIILTSPDGTTWTSRTSGVTSTLSNILSSGGRIVAVGNAGWITYSTNGTTWTATQPNSAPAYTEIIFTLGRWFASANSSVTTGTTYSTDGITWNYVAKPTTNNAFFIGWNNTYFFQGDVTTGEIWRSTDGITWTNVGFPASSTAWAGVGYGPIIFSTGVIAHSGSQQGSFYTDDGYVSIKAPRRINTSFVPTNNQAFINPLGDSTIRFAMAGGGHSSTITVLLYSVDGKIWSQEPKSPAFSSTVPLSTNSSKKFKANNYYFIPTGGGAPSNSIYYAPEPYDPSTNFQIPTKQDISGIALYIKAA